MKKITLTKAAVAVLIPVIYWLLMTGFNEPPAGSSEAFKFFTSPGGKNFKNVMYNWNPKDVDPSTWVLNQLTRYKGELNFTALHTYDYIFGYDNDGTSQYGIFNENLTPEQIGNITYLTSQVMGHEPGQQGLDFYFERCKLTKICYAQRLVYEVTPPPGNNTVNDGFCYSGTDGEYMTDQGRTVLHADPIEQYPNGFWLAKDIYENLQHSDGWGELFRPQFGDYGTWYIKPMMRIPVNTPDNLDVVRIDVNNFNDQPIKSITIKAFNFKDGGVYNGEYTDKYFNLQQGQELQVTGGDGTVHNPPTELNEGATHDVTHSTNGHVDFKVYWCGEVEVWFDKMTVDDKHGNELFKPHPNLYDAIIQNELENTYQYNFTYFADEVTWSQVPGVLYVKEKINQFNSQHDPDVYLTCCQNNVQNVNGLRNITMMYKRFIDDVEPHEFCIDRVECSNRVGTASTRLTQSTMNLTNLMTINFQKKNVNKLSRR